MASKRIKGITIEIDANTQPLTKALKDADRQINSATSNLRDVNKLLKLDPKNVELLTQKEKYLNEAIEGTKDKLKQEKEALEQLGQKDQTDEVVRQQEALQREILDTEHQLESLEQEYRDFGSVAVQQTRAAGEEMQAAGQKLQKAGGTIASAGQGMTTYVTAPIVAAGTAAVKTAADFDSAMSKVQAISGATSEEMEALRAKAREMGASTKFSATESAEALSYMAMAGWKSDQMLNGLEGIMHLAAASGEELGTTSDIVTDALTAFGMSAEESARFADILAAAATNSNTNVSMMGESFKYAAAPAGTLGYSAEDVALALGLMANNGIKADMAGTSLRNLFNRMAKPTKESQAAIDQLGLSLYDGEGKMYSFRDVMLQIREGFKNCKMSAEDYDAAVAALDDDLAAGNITQANYDKELEDLARNAFGAEEAEKARAAAMLGGTRAMSGLLAIAQTSDEDFEKLANAIDSSSDSFAKLADGSVVPLQEALASGQEIIEQYNGQAEAMAAIMEGNLNGDITRLKSALQELAIAFGELLIPEVREFVEHLQALVDKLNAMPEDQKQAIIGFAKFAAVIGPVLLVLGNLLIFIGRIIEAVGILKTTFAGVNIFASIQAGLASVTTAVSGALSAIGAQVSAFLVGIGGTILTACATIGASIVSFFAGAEIGKSIGAYIFPDDAELYAHYDGIKGTFLLLKDFLTTLGSEIVEGAKQYYANLKEATQLLNEELAFLWEDIKAKVLEIWDAIKQGVTEKVTALVDGVKEHFGYLKDFFKELISDAFNWGADLINSIKEGIKSKLDAVKDAASSVGNAIKERLHFSEPDVGPLSDFNTWMPDMMRQMADQINAGVPGVASAMQNVAGTMAGQINHDYSGQLASINSGIGRLAEAGSGNITVPVYIGQQKFAQAVVNANQSNNYRNGGR